ncbi:MAG: hypothetical protein JSR99_03075 [Proteobacteria bacterium]|nr:hypothetical protein [Pseudomonadota bacterium]
MPIRTLLVVAVVAMFAVVAHATEAIDPAQAIAQKFSEASDDKPAPSRRSFDRPDAAYEADMLQRARAEELERRNEEAQQTTVRPQYPVPSPSAPLQPAESSTSGPGPQLAALPSKLTNPEVPALTPEGPDPMATEATVLLVLDPNGAGLGFKPDPIICMDNRCWLSNGITSPAVAMPRNQAVALQTTSTVTADSCRGKSGCVYRNVPIDPRQRIDVIEVGEGGGASAGAYTVAADNSCRKEGDALVCDNGLGTENFRIWVVPESTAVAAGDASLEDAVAGNLPEPDHTSANDK